MKSLDELFHIAKIARRNVSSKLSDSYANPIFRHSEKKPRFKNLLIHKKNKAMYTNRKSRYASKENEKIETFSIPRSISKPESQ